MNSILLITKLILSIRVTRYVECEIITANLISVSLAFHSECETRQMHKHTMNYKHYDCILFSLLNVL